MKKFFASALLTVLVMGASDFPFYVPADQNLVDWKNDGAIAESFYAEAVPGIPPTFVE